jgi:hypothetical protein
LLREDATLGFQTVFAGIFVIGLVAIPLLYWLSTRADGSGSGQNQDQARDEEAQAERGT